MLIPRLPALFAALYSLLTLPALAAQPPPSDAAGNGRPALIVIAVSDFTGSDHELGRFLADTLTTDMARSTSLQPLGCTDVRHTLAELAIAPGASVGATQAKELLHRLHADRLVVGTFFIRESRITLNASLLDARTGLMVPGAATNVTGPSADPLSLCHRLARQLHKSITGADLTFSDDGEGAPATAAVPIAAADAAAPTQPAPIPVAPMPAAPVSTDPLQRLRELGAAPRSARPSGVLTEANLVTLAHVLAQRVSATDSAVTHISATGPVNRLRALTALARLVVTADDVAVYHDTAPGETPIDMHDVPAWGAPYVAAALEETWLANIQALHPHEPATWSFVAALAENMPFNLTQTAQVDSSSASADNEKFTGLVIDAGDLRVVRDMNAHIVDEDGADVYPDKKHLPLQDWVEDNGMAAYITDPMQAGRAGDHPLVIRALAVAGPGRDELVIANADAERVRAANRRLHFLYRWKVAISIGQ